MATPDVRIRLSAEGVAEVVSALKKVQAESGRAAGGAARSFGGLNSALAGSKALLAQLGVAVGVGALIALAKQGADAADQLGKMSQRVGASVANLSALRLAAGTANVTMESLTTTFRAFNTNVAVLQSGSKELVTAFKSIGLSAKDFAGKDAAQRLDLVAQAFGKLKDGPEKSALAIQLFGKRGQEIIPLLNDLSQGGLPAVAREADRLGVTLTESTAIAAQSVNDDFTRLQLQLQSGFAKFIEGLAPQIASTMKGIQATLGANADTWQLWGELVGGTVKGIGFILLSVFDSAATALRQLAAIAGGAFSAIDKAVRGNFKGAADDIGAIFEILGFEEAKFQQRQDARNLAVRSKADLGKLRGGTQETDAAERAKDTSAEEARLKRERERLELAKQRARIENAQRLAKQAELAVEKVADAQALVREDIDKKVAAGILTEREGRNALQVAVRAQIAELQKMLGIYVALVVTNPFDSASAAAAIKVTEEIKKLNSELTLTATIGEQVRTTAKEAFEDSFVSSIQQAIREGGTLLDVLRNIIVAIADAVAQMLLFKIAQSFGTFLFGPGPGAAEGGLMRGPGTGTSDSIPVRVSSGEYIVRAAAVSQPGVLDHLEAINRGMAGSRPVGVGPRRFAEGGLVTPSSPGRSESSLTVALAPGLVAQELETPEGQRAVVRVLTKNRRATGKALGGG